MTAQAPPRPRSRDAGTADAKHRDATTTGTTVDSNAMVMPPIDDDRMQLWGEDLHRLWRERSDSTTMLPWWTGVIGLVVISGVLLSTSF